jgi:hypothetical protein
MLVLLNPAVKKSRSAASTTSSATSGFTSPETSEPV